jgi:hypothetical protein
MKQTNEEIRRDVLAIFQEAKTAHGLGALPQRDLTPSDVPGVHRPNARIVRARSLS